MTEEILNYKNHFFQNMNELRLQNLLCDVHLDINGKTFSCHRVVLAAVSSYFRTMFNGNFKESKSDVVQIYGVESEAFEEILNTIYTAKINLLPSNAYCILKASHMMELETIKKVCISYICKNSKISYLIDTCLFAQSIQIIELYSKCVQAISHDLLIYGQTECFEKIPLEIFKSILSSRSFCDKEEEGVFLLILQWCRDKKANCDDTKMLLEAANLKITKTVRPIVMADLIVNSISKDTSLNEKPIKIIKESDVEIFSLNLYFNGIDIKTCDKGWGILKINDEFNKYVLSSFHATDSLITKVCQVGTMTYCLELKHEDEKNQKIVLSCYNDSGDKSVSPKAPPFCYSSFDVTAMNKTIYVLPKGGILPSNNCIFIYDCERNIWEPKFFGSSSKFSFDFGTPNPVPTPFFSTPRPGFGSFVPPTIPDNNYFSACTSSENNLYLIVEKRDGSNSRYLASLDFRTPEPQFLSLIKFEQDKHVNAAICAFDKKVALSGSKHKGVLQNTFSIFDITAKRWLYDVKPMQIGRANHNLIHHNGFVYAVENELPLVNNEKYNLKLNKWITIPSLPRRVAMEYNDDTIAVATGSVFGIDVLC